MNEEQLYTLQGAHQEFAKSIYNGIWGLLEKGDRSLEEDRELLLAAYASLYHWKKVGTAVHEQRGSWMISRVYQVLGRATEALEWAETCQELTLTYPEEMEDFDLAYAEESLARALALAGDTDRALEHWNRATSLGEKISDLEDKKIFLKDLKAGNWYQLQTDLTNRDN